MECTLFIAVDVMISRHADDLVRSEANQLARAIKERSGRVVVSALSLGGDVTNNKNSVHVSKLIVHLLYVLKHPLAYGAVKISVR